MKKGYGGPAGAPVRSKLDTYCYCMIYNRIGSLAPDFNLRGLI